MTYSPAAVAAQPHPVSDSIAGDGVSASSEASSSRAQVAPQMTPQASGAPWLQAPDGRLDLAPGLERLHAVRHLDARHPRRVAEYDEVAQRIAFAPVLSMPMNAQTWPLITATRDMLDELLREDPEGLRRPPGMQASLALFRVNWNKALMSNRAASAHILSVSKPVPLPCRTMTSSSIIVPMTLGAEHPEPQRLLACTARAPVPASGDRLHSLAALSVVSTPSGLLLTTSPEAAVRSTHSARELALSRLQDHLLEAWSTADCLQYAISTYNQSVQADLLLSPVPELPKSMALASLEDGEDSANESSIWLDYETLATPGLLDELVEGTRASALLADCRRVAEDITVRAASAVLGRISNKDIPFGLRHLRHGMLQGCVLQMCMEAASARTSRRQSWTFDGPVRHVLGLMTPMELNVLNAAERMLAPVLKMYGWVRTGAVRYPAYRAYVDGQTALPMACVRLVENTAETSEDEDVALSSSDEEDDHDVSPTSMVRALGPGAWADSRDLDGAQTAAWSSAPGPFEQARRLRMLGPLRDSSHNQFIDELKPLRLQPEWVNRPLLNEETTSTEPPQPPALVAHRSKTPQDGARPGLADDARPGLAPGGQGLGPDATAEQHARLSASEAWFDKLFHEIRQPGEWSGFSAELAPRLITECPGWPPGRALDIRHVDRGALLSRAQARPDSTTDATPVVIALDPARRHYLGIKGHQLIDVNTDGDCFYTAVLISLGSADRAELLRACGIADDKHCSVSTITRSLRQHFAAYLSSQREAYRDRILQLHQMIGP